MTLALSATSRDWHAHFMQRARDNSKMSTCCKRHVGAVATLGKRQLADGFNGNLPGAVHCVDGGCPRCADSTIASGAALGRCVCVHAETNLVAWCARRGISLEGSTVYVSTQPCIDCAKLLISAGVTEVVYDEAYLEADVEPLVYDRLKTWKYSDR